MERPNVVKMIIFTEGDLAGEKAYVTYEEGEDYLRVTPVKGDPLCSIELSRKRGGFKELPTEYTTQQGDRQ